jgi:hypothetical protein
VLLELLRRHADDMYQHIDSIFPEKTIFPGKYIDKFIDNLLEYLKTKQNIIKIFIVEFVKENEANDDLMLFEIIKPLSEAFSEKISQIIRLKVNLFKDNNALSQDFLQIFTGIVPIFTFYAFGDKIGGYLGQSYEVIEQQFANLLKENMKQYLL